MTNVEFGSFPFDWNKARACGDFAKITDKNSMYVVSGEKTPVLLRFVASSDVLHMGEMIIPSGGIGPRQTEYDVHKGDAVFYVIEGTLTFLIRDSEDVYEVPANEYMFIPEGVAYKCINYTGTVVKAYFMVAPEL